MIKLKVYTKEFLALYRKKALLSVLLKLVLGFSRGISLLMLVPLLKQSGFSQDASPNVDGFIRQLFHFLGLKLNMDAILVTLLILAFLYAMLNYAASILDTRIISGYSQHLKSNLAEKLLNSNWLYLKQKQNANIYSVFLNQIELISFGSDQLVQFVGSAIMFTVYLSLACFISLKMTGIALLLLLPLVLVHRILFRKAVETGSEDLNRKQEEYLRLSSELQLIKEIKVYQKEAGVLSGLKHIFNGIYTGEVRFSKVQNSSTLIFELGTILIFVLFFTFAFYYFDFPLVELIILIYLIGKLMPLASSLASNYLNLLNMLPAYENYQKLIKDSEEHHDEHATELLGITTFETDLQLCNIHFHYPEKQSLFSDFSAEIKTGKLNLITGPSGKGKSTLIEIVLGLLKPQKGEVLINGKNSALYNLKEYRDLIAYVPQEIQLLHTSIRENLTFSESTERDEEIHQLISACPAFHFLQNLDLGLDTITGENGIQLSGGERQRIALLRALLRKPRLLIIDEGTSAMDEETEMQFFDYLNGLDPKLTIILVTHRKQVWKRAEHLIEL